MQQPISDKSGILSFDFALLVLRINSRMPPPVGDRDFLDFIVFYVSKSVKMPKKKGYFSAEVT